MAKVFNFRYNLGHDGEKDSINMSRWMTLKQIEISPTTLKPALRAYTIYEHDKPVIDQSIEFHDVYEILDRITKQGEKDCGIPARFEIKGFNV